MLTESTIKIVLSTKHSFSKTQLVKPTFSPMSKNTFFKKRCHFWFWPISVETTIFIVFPGLHCFGPKTFFWPKQLVCTKMRFFSLPGTNSVRQFLQKNPFFRFFTFLHDHLKKHYFLWGFLAFSISFFFFFLSLFLQYKEDKNKKCNFLFEYLIFDIPKIMQKHYFGTV